MEFVEDVGEKGLLSPADIRLAKLEVWSPGEEVKARGKSSSHQRLSVSHCPCVRCLVLLQQHYIHRHFRLAH